MNGKTARFIGAIRRRLAEDPNARCTVVGANAARITALRLDFTPAELARIRFLDASNELRLADDEYHVHFRP